MKRISFILAPLLIAGLAACGNQSSTSNRKPGSNAEGANTNPGKNSNDPAASPGNGQGGAAPRSSQPK